MSSLGFVGACPGARGARRAPAALAARGAWSGAAVPRRARAARAPPPGARLVCSADAVEVSSASFEAEVLKSDIPVLVDFYASWCGPCKLVSPLMTWAASEYKDKLKVVKIDTEENKDFVNMYGIHGLPTFAVFKAGEAFGVQEGALGKQKLIEYILEHVPELA